MEWANNNVIDTFKQDGHAEWAVLWSSDQIEYIN